MTTEIDWDEISDEALVQEVLDRGIQEEFKDHIGFSSSDLSDDEIVGACEGRELRPSIDDHQLEQIWLAFRGKDCPQCLADYLWNTIGKAV